MAELIKTYLLKIDYNACCVLCSYIFINKVLQLAGQLVSDFLYYGLRLKVAGCVNTASQLGRASVNLPRLVLEVGGLP